MHMCRLPVPRPGQVLGLVGTNGIGKSTALKILAGKLKPNLGRLDVSNAPPALHTIGYSTVLTGLVLPLHTWSCEAGCKARNVLTFWHRNCLTHFLPDMLQSQLDWQEILTYFRGSELQNYFQKILEDDLKAIIKPQYVDNIPKAVR